MFLFFGAFIAGLLTVLAPCVLPLLPIIVGGSVAGNPKDKKRPVIIAVSLAVSIIVFTLLLKATTALINVPPQAITYFSGGVIVALGIVMLFPGAYEQAIIRLGIEPAALRLLGKGDKSKNEWLGAVITGAALGPVFSSCSPVYAYILATVLPANFAQAMAYMVSYVAGLCLVLLLIGYYGRKFVVRIKFASNPRGVFQRTVAVTFIIVGVLVATGYDTRFQVFVSDHTPFDFNGLSLRLLPASKHKQDDSQLFNVPAEQAPDFTGITDWINSPPLTMQQLRGKVVLVDFWTYSCINCIRNNVYTEKWYEAYKDDGFVVVGVHAPEFSFEKVLSNVEQGVKDQHITYPVAMDNNLDTWNAYQNESWPAGYLIDAQGNVRRVDQGEGGYTDEEKAIRQLLTDNGANLSGQKMTNSNNSVPITADQTPETYLGNERDSGYVGPKDLNQGTHTYTPASSLDTNEWTLGGTWEQQGQQIIARGNSTLSFNVAAKNVYLVGGSSTPQQVGITLDGKPISGTGSAGPDVNSSQVLFGESRLYRLVSFPKFSTGIIKLTVPDGVSFNAFTFGS